MATNADFDALIVRITTATNTLEQDVATISEGTTNVAESVAAAQLAEANAEAAAANAAGQVTLAQDQVALASTQAGNAANSASQAQALVTELENAVIIQEAPEDSQTYGRNNGDWVVVTGGGGGGAVDSVNGQTGVVVLSAADVGAKPSSYVPAWSEVTDKPTTFAPIIGTAANQALAGNTVIPTNTNQLTNGAGFVTAATAPVRSVAGKTGVVTLEGADIASGQVPVARLGTGTPSATTVLLGNGTWGSAPASTAGYPIPSVGYNPGSGAVNITAWPVANPNEAAQLSRFGQYVEGDYVEGAALFNTQSGVNALPIGNYWFPAGAFSGTPFSALAGNVEVKKLNATTQTAVVTTFTTPVNEYVWTITGSTVTWRPISSSGVGHPTIAFRYKGAAVSNWPNLNPMEAIWIGDCANAANTATGSALFASASALAGLPAGRYCFRSTDFASGALNGGLGFIQVDRGEIAAGNFQNRATAYIQGTATAGQMYVHKTSDGTWLPV